MNKAVDDLTRPNRKSRRPSGPKFINGQRIVRLREIRTPMPPFVMVTWGIFDLDGRKPLFKTLTRKDAAAIATREGWRYIGSQELA